MGYQGKRVVVVTPAGRQRYLSVLRHHVERSAFVDEWQLWDNTTNPEDASYVNRMRMRRGNVVCHASRVTTDPRLNIENIHRFFQYAAEPRTLYVRLDDDVMWLAEDFFETMLRYRMTSPDLLVSAAVINNTVCDWLRQRAGKIPERPRVSFDVMCPNSWGSGPWAQSLHESFLKDLTEGRQKEWHTQNWRMLGDEQFSINAICWRGEDMADVMRQGGVGRIEEAWLTETWPKKTGRHNVICGSALCVHFAFGPQREHLDKTDLLERYRRLAEAS